MPSEDTGDLTRVKLCSDNDEKDIDDCDQKSPDASAEEHRENLNMLATVSGKATPCKVLCIFNSRLSGYEQVCNDCETEGIKIVQMRFGGVKGECDILDEGTWKQLLCELRNIDGIFLFTDSHTFGCNEMLRRRLV